MKTYLKGRKIAATQDYERPPAEVLHLICKLRWMGMEEEAAQVQKKIRDTTPTGRVITVAPETD